MSQRTLWALTAALLALFGAPGTAQAELNVVATVPTLASVAKEVGGTKVEVTSLALPTQDPHFVDAKPSLILPLNKADLLLVVGLQLEVGWLPTLQTGARNGAIQIGAKGYLDCSQFVKLREIPQVLDRSQGDIHPGGNPHYLYDPRAVIAVAKVIAKRMGELDSANADFYNLRLKRFISRVERTREKMEQRLAAYQGQPVIAYHKSWVYLTEWLGLKQVAFLEPKPGIPPNPAHVAKVLSTARSQKVRAIIQEAFYPKNTAKLIADKSDARVVVVPGGVDFRSRQTYTEHLEDIATRLEQGLIR